MKKELYDYIRYVDLALNDKKTNIDKLKEEHLIKIKMFQHERLIHLLVTLFYSLFMIAFLIIGAFYIGFLAIGFSLTIFVIIYVIHYFKLENGVQYLYKQFDKMLRK